MRMGLCCRTALLLSIGAAITSGCSSDDDDDAAAPDGGDGGGTSDEWRAVFDPYEDGWLLSAWGKAPDDVWFAGGPVDGPVLLHYDGTDYQRASIEGDAPLWWIWGSGGGVFLAVGEGASIFRSDDDGQSFSRLDSPLADATYWGVWGTSPDDLWIVGQEPQADLTQRGVLLHGVDGGAFAEVDPIGEPLRSLFKVWGAAADDVWVVGESGTLLHYDGDGWTREDPGTNVRLFTIAGCSADDVWIVGGFGNGVVLHREQGAWVDLSPPFAPPINGVTCAPDAVWVVGMQGYIAGRTADGWREALPTQLDLHGVWAAGPHDAFAVGGNLISGGGAGRRGVLVRWGPAP